MRINPLSFASQSEAAGISSASKLMFASLHKFRLHLFNFLMWGVLIAGLAEFTDFQPVLMLFFILSRRIISIFANRAL